MPRNLVLCFDGTNNRFGLTSTNVVKLYAMLDRQGPDHLSYYQPGIGRLGPIGVWGRIHRWNIAKLNGSSGAEPIAAAPFAGTLSSRSKVYHYPWCDAIDRIKPDNLVAGRTPLKGGRCVSALGITNRPTDNWRPWPVSAALCRD